LSTIHTNDAPSVIMRLIDMGIEPFLINAAVSGVLAQRLARTICPDCKMRVEPSKVDLALLDKLGKKDCKLYRGAGCDTCMNLGYKGRTGMFELLLMTPMMRELVMKRPSFDYLVAQAAKDGMQPLVIDGLKKVDEGIISLQELVRVAL
jgi:type IV pilus assembly protein PilB